MKFIALSSVINNCWHEGPQPSVCSKHIVLTKTGASYFQHYLRFFLLSLCFLVDLNLTHHLQPIFSGTLLNLLDLQSNFLVFVLLRSDSDREHSIWFPPAFTIAVNLCNNACLFTFETNVSFEAHEYPGTNECVVSRNKSLSSYPLTIVVVAETSANLVEPLLVN